MAMRVKREGKGKGKGGMKAPRPDDKVLLSLRARIAAAIGAHHPELAENLSGMQFAIGTFAPSEIMKRFVISDYPFIGARYVSLYDGHVYIVAGTCNEGNEVLAYRLGFFQSVFGSKGGMAVSLTEDAWMNGVMIMYSLNYATFSWKGGEIAGVNDEQVTRRSYPVKKCRAWLAFLRRLVFGSPGAMDIRSPNEAHAGKEEVKQGEN